MTNALLIAILLIVIVIAVFTIMNSVILAKESKKETLVFNVLKGTLAVVVIVAVVLAVGGLSTIKGDEGDTSSDNVTLTNAGFNEVTIDEYLDLIKEPEKNVVLVARPTCTYCEAFTPILKAATDNLGITVNYIDTDKFSNDDWTTFNNSFSYLNETQWGTPLVLITQNGELVAENQGYVELATIEEFFTSNGLGE